MNGLLFSLPFDSRCLNPRPAREPLNLEKGGRVIWNLDLEEGWVTSLTPETLTVRWDESGHAVYARCSGAARENIVAIKSEEGGLL